MIQAPEIAGVRFRTISPPRDEALPRMDVAAFVGFATMGPVDLPVAVEDALRFRELFGRDLDLAWDHEAGRFERSRLARAVEAFFANGGERAWIVRVAGGSARSGRFVLPGLVGASGTTGATFEARSPGRWSDALSATAAFVRRRLRPRQAAGFTPGPAPGSTLAIRTDANGPVPGDLVEMVLPGEEMRGFLPIVASDAGGTLTFGPVHWAEPNPGGGSTLVRLPDAAGQARFDSWQSGSPAPDPAFYLLRLDLSARIGDGRTLRLSGLGLGAAHPRWFGRLSSDAAALAERDTRFGGPRDVEALAFLGEVIQPRFPLAADADGSETWLPLGTEAVMQLERAERGDDGLEAFSADLFLDSDLKHAGSGALAAEAERKVYFLSRPASGLHALWPKGEVALLALPDAGHRHWVRTAPPVDALPGAPVLGPPEEGAGASVGLSWSSVAGAESYRLEVAPEPDFPTLLAVLEVRGTEARYPLPSPCPRRLFFRVRAAVGGGIGPWSNNCGAWLPVEDAGPCAREPIRHATLEAAPFGSPDDSFLLSWTAEDGAPGPFEVELQSSAEPSFDTAATLLAGTATDWVEDQPFGIGLYVRVRLTDAGGPHPWSNTVLLPPRQRSDFSLVTEREYTDADLLAVHISALRFCAARGDATVALSIARHADPLLHAAALLPVPGAAAPDIAAGVPPLTAGERRVLGFGALHHPWVLFAADGEVAAEPPDGALLGHAAVTARERGAWIAAANIPVTEGLGLTEAYGRADRIALEGALVNPLVRDPRGILSLSDWTLDDDSALRFMNVRRLMILLRRLVLREGQVLVFAPNDGRFRQLVRSRLERAMERLYLRGVFRGATADEAFRVIADDSLNPRAATDAGRFVVELRVAPSRPLAFARVQLFQTDAGGLATRELP